MKSENQIHQNIIKFPGSENKAVDEQTKEFARLIKSISIKMNKSDFDQHILSHKELSLLSNHGEAIELAPLIAARLNSVLATSLIRNSLLEDLI
ncbi:hypothetical protein E5R92_07115 [Candidatus Pelagibacter giovannonii]|uniref:Uncharacterized protein n=1 Tax=Candidatus Pelagibacter giovannonii TaxID=2563896 RepID=A0A6H1Q629_9PROT|nr:hypothetical protein [Candidatus Pelagibacter giovannonii]QIZ21549.1 hypothetical protein E5R92_07115 [Candidatus Pelagibacter giovannonii]